MSHDLHLYGSVKAIYFKITLNGEGVPNLTLQDADISVSITTAGTPEGAAWSDIGNEVDEMVGANSGRGLYYWTPDASSYTQGEVLVINIKDDAGGPLFDENTLIIATGGHASARFSG